jgi:hypothetical protein
MAIQLSVAARNGRLDAIETELGSTPVLKIFTGAQPANCAAANSGTELTVASADVPAAAVGTSVVIGATTWTIAELQPDGTGFTRLMLK